MRRCRFIVVVDSDCDPDFVFADLGNALRKIRIDFGVPIDFDEEQFAELCVRKRRCAVATIRYADVDGSTANGWLLYIKPMLLGDEPPDVRSYAIAHETFPHETTADQWFSESQTESYRELGLHTLREVAEGWNRRHVGPTLRTPHALTAARHGARPRSGRSHSETQSLRLALTATLPWSLRLSRGV